MLKLRRWFLIGLVIALTAPMAWAADADEAGKESDEPAGKLTPSQAIGLVGACVAAALCVIGGGLAIARVGSACIEAVARQPEAAGSMFAPMVVSAAMIESGMLFAIVVCLLGMFKL